MNAALHARLEELRGLRDGWFHGGGLAPGGDFLDWMRDSFAAVYTPGLRACEIIPIDNGSLRLNWFGPGGALAADVYHPVKRCVVYALDRRGILKPPGWIDLANGWRRLLVIVHDFCG